jgi:hypothetical protein
MRWEEARVPPFLVRGRGRASRCLFFFFYRWPTRSRVPPGLFFLSILTFLFVRYNSSCLFLERGSLWRDTFIAQAAFILTVFSLITYFHS